MYDILIIGDRMNKKDKLAFYTFLMVISGVFGWIYEVIFYYINSGFKTIYMRGSCFLPWIDIYVIGGLFIYLINKKTKNPFMVFLKSGIICGLLEYITGYLLFVLFDGQRSWDYNTEILNFGNINGFICLRSVLFFAISGVFLMYVIVPWIKGRLRKKHDGLFKIIFITLFIIFLLDESYNLLARFNVIKTPSASDIYRKVGVEYMNFNNY